ncbi:NAD(P)/FAD-dependent oxidoreductase [Varunaivibrio sulfuroxidans]|uniref:Gamma-glutamylputrescine oxidase n=1 Tax=Varunaivibrio sulfuroxidans TaxID=1773489 RepID=A0A4R3JBV1_9PROT|nr:FAD-binding oxidoreductase [Varunaivibrio sulfuroxidans]TCS63418.1 gamma-glutamylputrescine oxidase [Varunaivibrio sulfuroxidans]WES30436.1 FAD-binding oxidoreductase [Varunaivibrio sulfuroxidans]
MKDNIHRDGDVHAPSYYAASASTTTLRPPLKGDVSCDVCVLGAGMTGASAALHLAQKGYKVIVLEARRVGWGASGRSGGQAIVGYNRTLTQIAALVGRDDAQKLWELGRQSQTLLDDLITRHDIDCDLKWGHLHAAVKPRQIRDLEDMKAEHDAVGGDLGGDYPGTRLLSREETVQRTGSAHYVGALHDPHSGHLHPLNYTLGLARAGEHAGAAIFEQSPATQITPARRAGQKTRIATPGGGVSCDHLILATNAYIEDLQPDIAGKIMPVGTYIIATEPLSAALNDTILPDDDAVADVNFVLNYFRKSADRRMLFGGRVSYSGVAPFNLERTMRRTMAKVYPQLADARIDYAWGGNVAITMNRLPHFGRLANNIYFAHGFSGHGVFLTGLAGQLMADAVAGTAERFDVFTRIPHTRFPGGKFMRMPALVLAMAYYKLRDLL